jgi:ABC-type multidrug transport system permease subunit
MNVFNAMVMVPMTFLCGTFFSLSQLPEAVKAALYVFPLTHVSQCLRASALGQAFPWLSFAALLGFGLAFLTGGIVVLKKSSV